MTARDANATIWKEEARLFSPGHAEARKRLGHDFREAKREGAWVWDEAGQRFLDGISGAGTFNLGRRHPELAQALKEAARATDQGNFPMISREKAALAADLAEFVGNGLECSVFAVVRGEALECACKVARGASGRAGLVTPEGGWYGQTGFALSLSQRPDKELYGPLIPEVATVPFGDLAVLAEQITTKTAAFILEPIQVENGCRAVSPEYAQAIRERCTATGALLVVDETQTGFGRTGAKFAFEALGIAPDLLIVGEALGGGIFPIAATLLTQRVNRFLNAHPMIHLSTFGGADQGCEVARKALEIYRRDQPWENAVAVGERLRSGLTRLRGTHPETLRSVTGSGLVLALEFGTAQQAERCCRLAAARGVLVLPGRVATNTVVIRPSLLLTVEEADYLVAALARVVPDVR